MAQMVSGYFLIKTDTLEILKQLKQNDQDIKHVGTGKEFSKK